MVRRSVSTWNRRRGTNPFKSLDHRSAVPDLHTLALVTSTWVLIVAASLIAFVDWWAVATDRRDVETVAKPLTMMLLIALAAVAGDAPADVRGAVLIGVGFGLIGDVALLNDGETAFLVGLGAFAIGHMAYAVAALLVGFDAGWAAGGIAVTAMLLGYRFATKTLRGARDHGGAVLAGAVVFYAAVISAMVVTAWATSFWAAALGATLFAASDWVLGHRRFVGPLPGGRLGVMVPYHVGQTLLILGILGGTLSAS